MMPFPAGVRVWLATGHPTCRGGERAAVMYTLIQTARLNDVDPQAWLAGVLVRISDHSIQRRHAGVVEIGADWPRKQFLDGTSDAGPSPRFVVTTPNTR